MSRSEIQSLNRMFEDAIRKQDAGAVAALYTPDAIVMPPDAPFVKGREAIRQAWAGAMSDLGLKAVTLDTVDLEIAGDCAVEVGEATLSLRKPDGTLGTAVVKFLVAWKKAGGAWRLHRDIWNAKRG
jgi:uncharacterized protein (TIGR02246 family)